MKVNIKGKTDKKTSSAIRAYTILFSSIVVVLALICIYVMTTPNGTDKPTGEQNNSSNNTPSTDPDEDAEHAAYYAITSTFRRLNSQDVLDMFGKQQSGFLYIGRPSCPYSRAFVPLLAEVVQETNTTIYYYNTDATGGTSQQNADVFNAIGITGVPTFIYIRDGIIAGRLGDPSKISYIYNFIQRYL